jgi:hypothetical protein
MIFAIRQTAGLGGRGGGSVDIQLLNETNVVEVQEIIVWLLRGQTFLSQSSRRSAKHSWVALALYGTLSAWGMQ